MSVGPSRKRSGALANGAQAIGRVRLTYPQYALLAVLVGLVAVIAAVGYRSSREVSTQTSDLTQHLETVSGDRISLERQVLTFALSIDRWSDGELSDKDLELEVALVERQRRVALDEAAIDDAVAVAVAGLTTSFDDVRSTLDLGRPLEGSAEAVRLDESVDNMVVSAKQLYDHAEDENFALIHGLEAGVATARRTEFVVAGLMVILVGLLVVSLHRMLKNNYLSAASSLRREQQRSDAARADQARAEDLSAAQTEILEMVALDTPMRDVLARIVELISPHLPGVRLRFRTGREIADRFTGSMPLSTIDAGTAIGDLEWLLAPGAEIPVDADLILRLAARLGSLAIDRRLAADQMIFQATHDSLTGLPNRTLLVDRVASAIQRAQLHDSRIAVMFLDLDRFKVVNDSLGHGAGDRLLVQVADRLAQSIRTADTVARFGGDEFVVLLEEVASHQQLQQTVERIQQLLRMPIDLDGTTAHVSASMGVVEGDGGSTVDELLKNADVAMYRAKTAGRDRYEMFDQEMQDWAANRHETETALRLGLDRNELTAFYQPLVQLDTMRVKGFEALARWHRPGFGTVAPAEFIDIAEDLGIIDEIGEQILRAAAQQLKEWRSVDAELTMSINVSGRELARPNFVAGVASVLEETAADPAGIILEITESVLLDDAEAIGERLAALRALGVRVAIDDFGTGYSSLRYLRELPVDILKIDRAFISAEHGQLHDPTIVASVTDLGHALGLEIVAEGIETPAQLDALRTLGIDSGQGYLFGRPAPAYEATAHIADQRRDHLAADH